MPFRKYVCLFDELIEGEFHIVSVEGIDIPVLLTLLHGRVYAGSSLCPHEDVSLKSGCIDDGHIICPAHGYEFDLRTGQATHTPKMKWKTYTSHVVEGEIYIDLF